MNTTIAKKILSNVLSKKCGATIPRTGKNLWKVNCFSVRINKENKWYLLLDSINNHTIKAFEWDGNKYSIERTVDLSDIISYNVQITHYFGPFDIHYDSYWDYILTGFTQYQKIKLRIIYFFDKTQQYLYNKRNLANKDRMQMLQYLVNRHIKHKGEEFSYFDVMTEIHSERWIFHPDEEEYSNYVKFVLESLLSTGDLISRQGINYEVAGKAMTTLSDYQIEEKRFRENKRMQKGILLLTIVLALVGIIQAIVTYHR